MSPTLNLDRLSGLPRAQRSAVALSVVVLLVLRARLLQLPREVITNILDRASSKEKISGDEVARALQQVYVKERDGSRTVLVPHSRGVSKVRLPRVRGLR